MELNQEIIAALRREVEKHAGRRMISPANFDFLASILQTNPQRPISSTTLKRVWGYVRDVGSAYTPSRYTLCTLAHFIGFNDIEDFQYSQEKTTATESDHYFGMTIGSDDLPAGVMIEVTWLPDRKVEMKHIAGSEFQIIRAENSKIHTGDLIECHSFTQNAPLYISRVSRADSQPFTYVAGVRTGVHFRLLPHS